MRLGRRQEGAEERRNRQGARLQPQALGSVDALHRMTATLPIDSNWIENQIRPWALGRSNWLFAGSLPGGQRGTNLDDTDPVQPA